MGVFYRLTAVFLSLFSGTLLSAADEPSDSVRTISESPAPVRTLPPRLELEPVRTLPHPKDAYCQGLFFERDKSSGKPIIYESCGKYGKSRLRVFDVSTGKTLRQTALPKKVFAEGLTVVGDEIVQLSWREGVGYVRDKESLAVKREFSYTTEGWGLTYNGENFILSDGSERLTLLDPTDFHPVGSISVFYEARGERRPLTNLNELEYIDGEIWANIYQTSYIARINPQTGRVIEFLNFRGYIPKGFENDVDHVLNGIAWDAASGTVYLTGKNWPVLYELRIKNRSSDGGAQ